MAAELAIDGGTPVRTELLPYGRQSIDDHDVRAVTAALRSDWLTTGPGVRNFESSLASAVAAADAVAVSSGTAALHAAVDALGIGPGDEVIVPAISFAATANCIVYQGGTPIFADVEPDTLLLDADDVRGKITDNTRAIIAVDYAGQPADYDALRTIADEHGIALVADACHAIGATYKDRPVGSVADLSTFSFHPVKHVTAGEGGAITTDDEELAARMRRFRNHGLSSDHHQRHEAGSWFYEMVSLGFNYRLTDLQCALATSQLEKLPAFVARRREIASRYAAFFGDFPFARPLVERPDRTHAYHLYVIRIDLERAGVDRGAIFAALRAEGIGVNVHYIPIHLHRFYTENFGTGRGMCPEAERAYDEILSLPMFPAMTEQDAADVEEALSKVLNHYATRAS